VGKIKNAIDKIIIKLIKKRNLLDKVIEEFKLKDVLTLGEVTAPKKELKKEHYSKYILKMEHLKDMKKIIILIQILNQ